jgi:hypothetical protein
MSEGCRAGSLVAKLNLPYKGISHCVGETGRVVADLGGILFLKMNDGGHQGMDDNVGQMRVTIVSDGAPAPILTALDAARANLAAVESEWLEITGDHVSFVVPTATLRRYQATVTRAIATMDGWYRAMADFVGVRPFHGQRIRIFPDGTIREVAWMAAENPIYIQPSALEPNARVDPLLALAPRGRINDYAHEMGHDFAFAYGRSYQLGRTMEEGWAHLIATYAEQQTGNPGRVVGDCEGAERFVATGTYAELTTNYGIPLCFLLEVERANGWRFFRDFFAGHARTNQAEIPEADQDSDLRWRWLRAAFDAVRPGTTAPIFDRYHLPR